MNVGESQNVGNIYWTMMHVVDIAERYLLEYMFLLLMSILYLNLKNAQLL
jgi:hypothetical protein